MPIRFNQVVALFKQRRQSGRRHRWESRHLWPQRRQRFGRLFDGQSSIRQLKNKIRCQRVVRNQKKSSLSQSRRPLKRLKQPGQGWRNTPQQVLPPRFFKTVNSKGFIPIQALLQLSSQLLSGFHYTQTLWDKQRVKLQFMTVKGLQ